VGREPPDLILLDLMLPDFDGSEICKMIRAHGDESISNIPIIMLTAMSSEKDRIRGLSLGADDYVCKPFSVKELLLRIEKQVRVRELKEARPGTPATQPENSAVKEFQEMVFHELSNQMLIVRGYSDRLYRHGEILPEEKVRSYAQAIYKSSTHLGSLAEEMLLLRNIERQSADLMKQQVNLSPMVEDLVAAVSPGAEEKGIEVTVDIPSSFPQLSCNGPSLKIILSCLLENAVKYGRMGGRVVMAAAVVNGGSNAIYVEDDGIGIPEGELESVFEKFKRGSNVSDSKRGTGLGLYFARTLAKAMGGEITVRSEIGNGSRFRLLLPPNSDLLLAN
jgi:signal transduction histidine kinase